MYALRLCGFRLDYELTVRTPLHVGGGETDVVAFRETKRGSKSRAARTRFARRGERKPDNQAELVLPIHMPRGDNNWSCFVPATSIRGVLRHHLRRRIDHALQAVAVDPAWNEDWLQRDPAGGDSSDVETADFGNILVRHLFGSEARRGALRFSRLDAAPARFRLTSSDEEDWPAPQSLPPADQPLRVLTRNRLDRFTMASTEGLRNMAALEVGTKLTGHVELDSFAWWQVGGLAVAMHDLSEGTIGLGTRSATGLGQVEVSFKAVHLRYHRVVAPDPASTDWPGVSRCWATLPPQSLAPSRFWGQFEQDGVPYQMFAGDEGDVLHISHPPGAATTDTPVAFERAVSWTDEAVCRDIMTRASRRLAAVAASLSTSPIAPPEVTDA